MRNNEQKWREMEFFSGLLITLDRAIHAATAA